MIFLLLLLPLYTSQETNNCDFGHKHPWNTDWYENICDNASLRGHIKPPSGSWVDRLAPWVALKVVRLLAKHGDHSPYLKSSIMKSSSQNVRVPKLVRPFRQVWPTELWRKLHVRTYGLKAIILVQTLRSIRPSISALEVSKPAIAPIPSTIVWIPRSKLLPC